MNKHADTIVARAAPGPLLGEFVPPGDKSVSHRALMLATLADGESAIRGLLHSKDVDATARACEQLGARITFDDDVCRVTGVGLSGLKPAGERLDMGNSGTAMRLLSGVLAAQPFDSVLTGDASLNSRPMNRIAAPLREMGAVIVLQDNGCAPIQVEGGHTLHGIHYDSPVASAQVKSCVLLAGLFADGQTSVSEPHRSRDHTERMLKTFGANITADGVVSGGSSLTATEIDVPADISSAAFALVASALVPGSRVMARNVGLNPTRSGMINAMQAMGCDLRVVNERWFGSEPVGDIEVRYCDALTAVTLGAEEIPALIDELPAMMVLAARCRGVTRIRGAAELRVKESDRIAVMAAGLKALGFNIREYADGIDIEGRPLANERHEASNTVNGAGDHRCAMSFCVLAQTIGKPVQVSGAANIDTSYPGFIKDLSALGGSVEWKEDAANAG